MVSSVDVSHVCLEVWSEYGHVASRPWTISGSDVGSARTSVSDLLCAVTFACGILVAIIVDSVAMSIHSSMRCSSIGRV